MLYTGPRDIEEPDQMSQKSSGSWLFTGFEDKRTDMDEEENPHPLVYEEKYEKGIETEQ